MLMNCVGLLKRMKGNLMDVDYKNQVAVLRGALRIIIDNLEDGDVNSALLVAKFGLTVEPKSVDESNY